MLNRGLKISIYSVLSVASFFACFGTGSSYGEIISSDRRIDWRPGVPGGVPVRTTIFANVRNAPYNASGNGSTDDHGAIQSALDNCPEGQVVFVPAGTYRITDRIRIPGGVVLRGEGSNTRIMGDTTDQGLIVAGSWNPNGEEARILSGHTKGSTSLSVSDASAFSIGDYIVVDQLNDPALVNIDDCTWVGRDNNARALGQIVEIVEKSGNTLTIDPALHYAFSAAQVPEIKIVNPNVVENVGLEDLYIERVGSWGKFNVWFQSTAYSWIKNVESAFVRGRHIQLSQCFRGVVRDCYVHEAHNYCAGANAYGISIYDKTSETLVENNIGYFLNVGIVLEGSGAGNVIAYNYLDDMHNCDAPDTSWLMADLSANHCAHPYMNLFEGNQVSHISPDFEHGSSSHQTFFRNYADRDSAGRTLYHRMPVDIWFYNRFMTLVGNVLGKQGDSVEGSYEIEGRECGGNEIAVYKLGYNSDGDCNPTSNDPQVLATLLRHGNFNYVTNSVVWDPNISDQDIPNSLYLQSKPSFFGSTRWPPFGSDLAPRVVSLPAKKRFDQLQSNTTDTVSPSAPTNLRAVLDPN